MSLKDFFVIHVDWLIFKLYMIAYYPFILEIDIVNMESHFALIAGDQ